MATGRQQRLLQPICTSRSTPKFQPNPFSNRALRLSAQRLSEAGPRSRLTVVEAAESPEAARAGLIVEALLYDLFLAWSNPLPLSGRNFEQCKAYLSNLTNAGFGG